MFGCRSPSRRSARWTTSLQPSLLQSKLSHIRQLLGETLQWCDNASPGLHCRCPSCPPSFSWVSGIIRPKVVLSPALFSSEELCPQRGHMQLLPGDRHSSQHCFFLSHLSPELCGCPALAHWPVGSSPVLMPPQLFVLVFSSGLMLEQLSNERFRGRKLLSCLSPSSTTA